MMQMNFHPTNNNNNFYFSISQKNLLKRHEADEKENIFRFYVDRLLLKKQLSQFECEKKYGYEKKRLDVID